MDRSIYTEYEQDLLERIGVLDQKISEIRQRLSNLRSQINDQETDLIGFNLNREKLIETLRVYRKEHFSIELTDRQIDIAKFREKLPELLNKIK